MKITTCMPIYNGASCLTDAFETLLQQTRQPDEVIVVDDASTDKSMEIIKSYESRFPMKIYQNENRLRIIGNWNSCLEKATGDIVTALHQDDGYMPDFLKEVEQDFKNNPSIGLWACVGIMKSNVGSDYIPKVRYRGLYSAEVMGREVFLWQYTPPPTPTVFKREALEKVGLYNKDCQYTSEADLYFRIAGGGYDFIQSDKVLVWRTTPDNRATALYFETPLLFNDWFNFLERWIGHEILKSHKNVNQEAVDSVVRESAFVMIRLMVKGKWKDALEIYKTVSERKNQIAHKIKLRRLNFFGALIQGVVLEMIRQMKSVYWSLRSWIKGEVRV